MKFTHRNSSPAPEVGTRSPLAKFSQSLVQLLDTIKKKHCSFTGLCGGGQETQYWAKLVSRTFQLAFARVGPHRLDESVVCAFKADQKTVLAPAVKGRTVWAFTKRVVADRKQGRTACYRHGLFTNEAIGELRMIRELLRDCSRSGIKLRFRQAPLPFSSGANQLRDLLPPF